MKLKLIAVGKRMPTWVTMAFDEYRKRLPREINFELIEIDCPKRQKQQHIAQLIAKESKVMLSHIGKQDTVIALDEHGTNWNTKELAKQLHNWLQSGSDICLLVGGPDGLADSCKQRATQQWALSALTLPHPIIRPIIAEQIYRAWTILHNHPYHRE